MAERPDDISELELARFLDGLPRRYLSVFGLATIYQHVRLARGLLPGEVHASLEKRDDIWELTVAALDKPYLFSNIAGVLSYFGMDIHRGQAMTTPDHLVLDVFEFSDEEGFLRQNAGRARRDRARAQGRRGRHDRRRGAAHAAASRACCTAAAATSARTVNLDNEHSQTAHRARNRHRRRAGLLHRISRVVSEQGCDVDLVLISTEGRKAMDVLHVTKAGPQAGRRPTSALLKRELEQDLGGHR